MYICVISDSALATLYDALEMPLSSIYPYVPLLSV